MLNEILEKLAGGIGNLAKKVHPAMKKGKFAEFWKWVDQKWYRAEVNRYD